MKQTQTTETQQHQPRAVLVCLNFNERDFSAECNEFRQLVASAGFQEVSFITGTRTTPSANYFIGQGKADEVSQAIIAYQADVVIIDHDVSPSQERNLERYLKCRILDRTGLILEIFAQRARTFEGKLQVERAQLQHLSTRLVRGWTHLERQKGGINLRGPGEKQIEVDRRLIAGRIKAIDKRLAKVRSQRYQNRRSRQRAAVPVISLVGYTNAGKSSLFNQLTHATVYVANQLFATLDPTVRQLQLPDIGQVVLTDTVGFVRKLPHSLIAAFRATLEETVQSDLLLHVVDAADPEYRSHLDAVESVLQEIGADKIPRLQIYNKIDLLPHGAPRLDRDADGKPWRVSLSTVSGAGFDLLQQALVELLGDKMIDCIVELPNEQGKLRATLYALAAVKMEEQIPEGGWRLQLRLHQRDYHRLLK